MIVTATMGETAVSADVADAVTDIQDPARTIMVPAPFEQSAGQKKRKASCAKANRAKVTQSSTTNQLPVQMPAPLAPSSAQAQSSNHMQQPRVTFSHPHMSRQITYAKPLSLPPLQAQAWSPTHTTFSHPHMSRQIIYAEPFSLPQLHAQAWLPTHMLQPVTFSHPYMTQQRMYAESLPSPQQGFQPQTPFTTAGPSLTVDNTMNTSQGQSSRSAQSSLQFVNHTASDYFMDQ